ncbi:hypothetical protein [Mycobacterium avium]|uniref:Uncharacterized protein n=1 Tax=Mycobacterium avium subsp. hominissuis TaxID=439334 RepID=A0AAI8X5E4_MYCAV|nr:hypothetical protein [Mycobacterium avium]BBN50881.1 hypothetical protein JPH1_53560 [Mycobacterium avium subsp. hominissuis]
MSRFKIDERSANSWPWAIIDCRAETIVAWFLNYEDAEQYVNWRDSQEQTS